MVVSVTQEENTDDKIYYIKQGTKTVGEIHVPKDMTVQEEGEVGTEEGAFGLRYYNNTLQYNDNGTWKTICITNLFI